MRECDQRNGDEHKPHEGDEQKPHDGDEQKPHNSDEQKQLKKIEELEARVAAAEAMAASKCEQQKELEARVGATKAMADSEGEQQKPWKLKVVGYPECEWWWNTVKDAWGDRPRMSRSSSWCCPGTT